MTPELYSFVDVLAVAKIHPFYVPDIQYPPDAETIRVVRERAAKEPTKVDLRSQPLRRKKDLYTTIERLVNDPSPRNTYRHSVYASITGGGVGSTPLFFATDVYENRRHRARFGQFVRATGLVEHGDWVLTTHNAGGLYRSLDLTLEILENAGASVLGAGNLMPPAEVTWLLTTYHINVLTGDSSSVVQIVHYLSTLSGEERDKIKLDKIIYTSEVLTAAQRALIKSVLGPVKICSILASAEAGPWAVSSPDLTGMETVTSHADFVFDTRTMLVEILPLSSSEDGCVPDPLPQGEQGIIVQTSLSRLRNPLVRYDTGDIGSLHPLPEHARAIVPDADWQYLQVLRLHGRDHRFSFDWDGEYLEFDGLTSLMNNEECGILQWQIILDKMEPSLESSLEVRLLCSPRSELLLSEEAVVKRIRTFVHAYSANEHRFRINFVQGLNGFERSSTGRKVIKFVDRYN
ncbi:Uncharacterized protein TPAR_01456 [Tolypocladium paradoxum]|uniref:AMP-dependent synthetase/ligase domain-containing protein n=1 Tax=Tolypocladium paradoxum TaxID=94208 RepID=A0A2S4L7C1_9HYPO|nr:Uncharacterized protein TPAR_01456 [Tolypocladium paradoxum]